MKQYEDPLDKALEAYSKHFGKNYPLVTSMACGTEEELIKKILKCIEENTPAPLPVYHDDRLY